jgi:flagellar biosynthesis/type III secretory pathway protein FliH
MSSIKFETFSPVEAETTASAEKMMQRMRSAFEEGRRRGFAEGAAASAEEHAAAQDQLRSQFIESLNDQRIGHEEARLEVTKTILPTLQALVTKLAPTLARAGLTGIVEDTLSEALRAAPASRPVIHCAPELAEGIRQALANTDGGFAITPDPRLTPLEARVTWDEGFTHIDLQACIDRIEDGVAAFAEALTMPEETRHVG